MLFIESNERIMSKSQFSKSVKFISVCAFDLIIEAKLFEWFGEA
jgi:hypothetical protein